jgi:hypothetical protein
MLEAGGLEADYEEVERRIESLTKERAEVAAAIRLDEGALQTYPEAEFVGVPDEAPSYRDLLARCDAARAAADDLARRRRQVAEAEEDVAGKLTWAEVSDERVEDLRRKLAEAEAARVKAWEEHAAAKADAGRLAAAVAAMPEPDLETPRRELEAAEQVAAKVGRKRERRAIEERWTGNRETSAALVRRIDEARADLNNRLLRADLPVSGVTWDGEGLLVDGVPLAQVNSAKQIAIGLAVAAAARPHLRVAAIRDGSLLDDASLTAVQRWAAENDYQVWVERVGRSAAQGVVIENGRVAAVNGEVA